MKSKILSIVVGILALVVGGCTHSGGDIGPWYGQWRVTSIDIDGTPAPGYDADIFISFQTSVVMVTQALPTYYYSAFGSWSEHDGEMTLEFTGSDDARPNDDPVYTPPEALLLDSRVTVLRIEQSTGSRAILSYVNSKGEKITYTLRRWG